VLRLGRINRYFENLIDSFDVMVDGMDKQQFLQFRMALMPASGFQSVQYRMIEIASTALENLTDKEKRRLLGEAAAHDELMGCIYWKAGATIEDSGAKALTLIQFERSTPQTSTTTPPTTATATCGPWCSACPPKTSATRACCASQAPARRERERELAADALQIGGALPAARPHRVAATGGTNWRKYLPPKFQRRIFYPQLWTEQELEDWGKGWVEEVCWIRDSLPLYRFLIHQRTHSNDRSGPKTRIDASLEHVRVLHNNMSSMWDGDAIAAVLL
jgi:tryptophan 2,3-dioxygenase